MRSYYQNELVKRANLLHVLNYVMQVDFIRLVQDHYSQLNTLYQPEHSLVRDMLRDTPAFKQGLLSLPISKVEDIVSLIDSHSSTRIPMAVIYYHLLTIRDVSD